MNAQQLAALIDGRQYPFEMTDDEKDEAKKNGLVVVYGDSDDLLEFRGAIEEELSAWNGTTACLNEDGLIENDCDDEDCPYHAKEKRGAVEITSIWCNGHEDHDPDGGPAWTIKTDIPHVTFDIKEDDDIQSRGIVFSMDDLKAEWKRKNP